MCIYFAYTLSPFVREKIGRYLNISRINRRAHTPETRTNIIYIYSVRISAWERRDAKILRVEIKKKIERPDLTAKNTERY